MEINNNFIDSDIEVALSVVPTLSDRFRFFETQKYSHKHNFANYFIIVIEIFLFIFLFISLRDIQKTIKEQNVLLREQVEILKKQNSIIYNKK